MSRGDRWCVANSVPRAFCAVWCRHSVAPLPLPTRVFALGTLKNKGKKWGVVPDSAHRRAGCRGVDLVVERGGWVHCAQSTPGMSSSATRTTPAIASPHLLHAFALRGRKTFVLRICLWWAMGHASCVCPTDRVTWCCCPQRASVATFVASAQRSSTSLQLFSHLPTSCCS